MRPTVRSNLALCVLTLESFAMRGKSIALCGCACFMAAVSAGQEVPKAPVASERRFASHPPMRSLPQPRKAALSEGPKRFVDSQRGDDAAAGTEQAPWRTLQHALRQLNPGQTLYLRGGTYYEHVALTQSGEADAPITISSYPGELAVLD